MTLLGRVALGVLVTGTLTGFAMAAAAWFAADSPVSPIAAPPSHIARLSCGPTTLVVKTYCTGLGAGQQCDRQDSLATTKGSADAPARDSLRPNGTAAVSVQCYVSKKKEMFFALTYATGGNCDRCEWVDLLDMRLRPLVPNAQRHKRAVTKLHRHLSAVGDSVSLIP